MAPDGNRAGRDSNTRFVDDYLLYLLARASHQASHQFHQLVRAQGLQVPEWRVLASLSDGPRTIGELAALTLLKQPTLTRIVDRMARGGLVARQAHARDGRKVVVAATAKGRAAIATLLPAAKRHEAAVLAGYSAEEAASLKAVLRRLIERTG